MPERMVETDRIGIWCEDRGDPADPPILLVTGATASALHWRGAFCDDLAARGRYVIRFDGALNRSSLARFFSVLRACCDDRLRAPLRTGTRAEASSTDLTALSYEKIPARARLKLVDRFPTARATPTEP